MKTIVNGVYPTMLTPFKNGEIDYDSLAKLVEYYYNGGCKGLFAVCQSSEMQFLSLKERVNLAKAVLELSDGRMDVVASGHISDNLDAQAEEVTAIFETGVKVATLISNRFDINNEGDDRFIENAEKFLEKIPKEIPLGFYECPRPYKRLLSDRLVDWCVSSGRISFIKDTCCDPATLERRLQKTKDTGVMIFNANGQTLLHSLRHGAAGYSGIMANFCPKLASWLCENYNHPDAEKVSNIFSMISCTENPFYPMSAKYNMQLEGIDMSLQTRSVIDNSLPEYQRFVVRQIRSLYEDTMERFNIK